MACQSGGSVHNMVIHHGHPFFRCAQVVVQSNIMVLATNDCVVIRWNVDSASDPEGKRPPKCHNGGA